MPFGKYELLERINIGGMAEILKARDTSRPGSPIVAVKRILPHLTEDQQYVTMFLDESRVLAQLEHDNVIRTLEVGQVGETPFIALEYVFGQDARMLFHRARKSEQRIPISVACYIIAKCCDALHYAHEHEDAEGNLLGVVHRDVSLQNILLSYDGQVKLTDFGIAMSAENRARTEVGIVKGKFGYMSPEQIKGEPMDRRSDVFAAGICLYELLTSERLFSGDSDYAAVERVRNVAVEPPSRWNREIPSSLEAIVMKALAKHPRDRYQSAADLRRALLAFMSESHSECSPRALEQYLRTVFADDIAKQPTPEALRAETKRRRDEPTGLAAFDDLDPISTLSSPSAVVPSPGAVAPPRAPRAGPGVPPVVPHSDSIPPDAYDSSVFALRNADASRAGNGSDQNVRMSDVPGVGLDWDDEELPTGAPQPRTKSSLMAELEAELGDEVGDNDVTRQVYIGETFSGAPAGVSDLRNKAPGSVRPPAPEVVGVPSPFDDAEAPAADAEATRAVYVFEPARALPQTSYFTVVAIVVGIIAVIAVALYATRGAAPAQVYLSTLPVDAEVRVDGKRVPGKVSPFVLSELLPGAPHKIEVGRAGYSRWSTDLVLDSGQVLHLPQVTLVPEPAAVTARVTEEAAAPVEPEPKADAQEAAAPQPAAERVRTVATTAPSPKREPREPEAARVGAARAPSRTRSGAPPRPPAAAPPHATAPSPVRAAGPAAAPAATPASAAGKATLRINSRPWSVVTIDGRRVGNTPQMNLVLSPGTHNVQLANSQFGLKKTVKIKLAPGETQTKIIDLQ
ncbi:MAG: serine/threonine-protein kinase [Polyangiales bacterium]